MADIIKGPEPDEKTAYIQEPSKSPDPVESDDVEVVSVNRWDRIWPVLACGAGLFSDGYLNGVRMFFPMTSNVSVLTDACRLLDP